MRRLFLFFLLISDVIQAGTIGDANRDLTWFGTINIGSIWERSGQTQTFYLTPEVEKSYIAQNYTHDLVAGEIFLGLQKDLPQSLQAQLGIAFAITDSAPLSGHIWDDANSEFNNYDYSYFVQHTHIAFKGKLLADRGYWFLPWVSVSLGLGFNDAHNFKNKPLIFEAVADSNFSSHITTAFTYTLGVGIQREVYKHLQVGIGYEFSDWGKSQLGRALGQTMNNGLSLENFYTNGVMANLTYTA